VSEPFRLRIGNSYDAVASANADAGQWLEENHVAPAATMLANLAVEELVTNCIKYGYDDRGEHFIDVEMQISDGRLVLHFSDDGRAFNPLEAPEPDFSLPIEDRPIGGLGLHLLRSMADSVTYERRDGLNRVTLVKTLDEVS